jgi:hypothetical protein
MLSSSDWARSQHQAVKILLAHYPLTLQGLGKSRQTFIVSLIIIVVVDVKLKHNLPHEIFQNPFHSLHHNLIKRRPPSQSPGKTQPAFPIAFKSDETIVVLT